MTVPPQNREPDERTPMFYHLISIGAGVLGIAFTILNLVQLALLFDVTSLTSACIGVGWKAICRVELWGICRIWRNIRGTMSYIEAPDVAT